MPSALSSTDLERLQRAMSLMVSPPLHPSMLDEWRAAVVRELKEFLGADMGGFHLVVPGLDDFYTEDLPRAALECDLEPPPLSTGIPPVQRGLQVGVGVLERLYVDDPLVYLSSVYYNDYAIPFHKHETLFTLAEVGRDGDRALASLQFFNANPRRPRFGERELTLLRLLFPAFKAGVDAVAREGAARADLMRCMDDLGLAILVCDVQGCALHQTRALAALLSGDAHPELLRGELLEAARGLATLTTQPADRHLLASIGTRTEQRIRTRSSGYVMRGSLCDVPGGSGSPLVLIGVERLDPQPASDEEIIRTYGLTRAELRVARLLARGMSNGAVAKELVISPNTARTHTERVLRKLGVHSRSGVRGVLKRVPPQ